jgi:hypothetical protein
MPMSAVDMDRVKKNCWITLVQTTIRDMAVVGAVAAGLIIEPWGMITVLAVVAAAVMLTFRSRFFLALIVLGVVCVALALVNGNRNERISLGIPLACLALCFLAYLADVWLSMYHVRRLWRKSARQEKATALRSIPANGSLPMSVVPPTGRKPIIRTPARFARRQWPYAGGYRTGGSGTNGNGTGHGADDGNSGNGHSGYDLDLASQDGERAAPVAGAPVLVYYGSGGIVGAGTPLPALPLTVPLAKPLDANRDIETFSVSDLMTELIGHLLSQGTGDVEAHGWAYQPLSANGSGHWLHEPGHFTYGLPHLDVAEVKAMPAPDSEKFLGTPLNVMRLSFLSPPGDEMLGLANRSPSMHPERYYVRVRTTSWDGQLTATVFVNAALQGHFLRMIMRPYVLAPVVNELNAADELTKWNPFFLACVAVLVTTRQFLAGAKKFKRSDDKPEKKSKPDSYRSGLRSTREYYAKPYASNMHQSEDSARAIQVIKEKIFTVTMDFLRARNIDVDEYEKQVQNIIYNSGVYNTGDNNQINNNNNPQGGGNNQSNSKSN